MPDQRELLRRLAQQIGDKQTLDQLRAALNTPNGQQAAQIISNQHADDLERAAQAVQRGDMREAAMLAQKMMQTREGANLAAQLKKIFHN